MTHDDARKLLEFKRARLERLRESRNTELPPTPSSTLSDYEQAADVGNERLEVELELSVSSQLQTRIYDIEHALSRLRDGSWGKCEACGDQIPEERLEVRPESRFCTSHQEQVDRVERILVTANEEPLRIAY